MVIHSSHCDNQTVKYAAQELDKYVEIMLPNQGKDFNISLGLLEDFDLPVNEVSDIIIDDVVDICIENAEGYIAGSNFRSILQGVYIYLKSAGCLWVRPGENGEYIPRYDLRKHSFKYHKKADYSFRGEVIEGAVSFQNIKDNLLWFPKVGYNIFYLQYMTPYLYFRRWYEHHLNPSLEKVGGNSSLYPKIKDEVAKIEKLANKLGIMLNNVGHGWLFEQYGLDFKGGDLNYEVTPEIEKAIAKVDGKREWFHGSPGYTQICMSNDEVRNGAEDCLISYIKDKPYLDFVSVSLADNCNNHCECEKCRNTTPTDFYVKILNELDNKMTAQGINTRIMCGFYVDTYWPPIKEKLHNTNRFIFKLALQREYNTPISNERYQGELPEWERNKYRIKPTVPLMLSFLDEWKKSVPIKEVVTFDYDLWSSQMFDPGYFDISRLISKDVKYLKTLNILGRFSCQSQRCAFPTALADSVQAETLFDSDTDFDDYTNRYFSAAYGENGAWARKHLEKITDLFNPKQLRINKSIVAQDTGGNTGEKEIIGYIGNKEAQIRLSLIPEYIQSVIPEIERNMNSNNACHNTSWNLLRIHADYCTNISKIFYQVSLGNKEAAKAEFEKTRDWLFSIEDEIQPYFDVYLFCRAFKDFKLFDWTN